MPPKKSASRAPASRSRPASAAASRAGSRVASAVQSPKSKTEKAVPLPAEEPAAAAAAEAQQPSAGRRTRTATGAIPKHSVLDASKALDMPQPLTAGARRKPSPKKNGGGSKKQTPVKGPKPTSVAGDSDADAVDSEPDMIVDPLTGKPASSGADPFAVGADESKSAAKQQFTQAFSKAAAKPAGKKGAKAAAVDVDADAEPTPVAAADGAPATAAPKKHRAEPRAPRAGGKKGAGNDDAVGRLKVLLPIEKKACSALRDALLLVANEAALRTNRIPQLCHDITGVLQPVASEAAELAKKQEQDVAAKDAEATPAKSAKAVDADAADGGDDVVDADAEATATTTQPTAAKKAAAPKIIPLPPADVPAVLGGVIDKMAQVRGFFEGNVDECQLDLDDNVIVRPLAFAIAKALNAIEGFVAPPEPEYTDKMREARRKAVEALKDKRDKLAEKARAKEAEVLAKQEEKRKAELAKAEEKKQQEELQRAAKGLGVEDTLLAQHSDVAGVTYAPLPLHSPQLFEAALRVWTTVTSLPKLCKVSQMPFSTFLLGLQDTAPKATIMRDVLRGLIQGAGGDDIVTRAKEWFPTLLQHYAATLDVMVEEAAAAASGKKLSAAEKRRLAAERKKLRAAGRAERAGRPEQIPWSDSDDEGDDSDEDDDDDDDDEASDDEEASEEEAEENAEEDDDEATGEAAEGEGDGTAEPAAKKTRPETPKQRARREALEKQADLRELHATYAPARACAWHLVTVPDRLKFLTFFVDRALESKAFINEAEALQDRCRADLVKAEKRMKEIRDEAEAAAKAMLKTAKAAAKPAPKKKGKKGDAGASGEPSGDDKSDANASGSDNEDDDDAAGDSDDDAKVLTKKKKPAGARKAAPVRKTKEELEQERVAALAAMSKDELEQKRQEMLEKAAKQASVVYVKLREKWEKDDHGLRVLPLGEDRHRRLCWYFPQDRRILVQTVDGYSTVPPAVAAALPRQQLWGTPAPAAPSASPSKANAAPATLIDEEEEEDSMASRRRRNQAERNATSTVDAVAAKATAGLDALELTEDEVQQFATQTRWGYVSAQDLPAFIASLNERGKREGPLRRVVDALRPHVEKQDLVQESTRVTRRSQTDFGYLNRQRPNESGWAW